MKSMTKKTTKRMKKLIGLRSEPQEMKYDDYDARIEQPALDVLAKAGATGMLVTELGVACFYGAGCPGRRAKSLAQAKSWGRNSLRRPLREGAIERVSPGRYRLTRKGSRQVSS